MLTIIFSTLPFFVAICWLGVYVIDYREHKRDKKIFAYMLATLAVLYLTHATFYLDEREVFGVLESLYAYCYLAVYPLSYLYIKALTDPRPLRKSNFTMMVIPVAVFIWSVACYIAMGSDREIFIDHYFFREGPAPEMTAAVFLQIARLTVSRIIFALQIILVIIYGSKNLNSFKKKVSDFYSNVDGHDLRSIRLFIRIMWGYSAVALITSIVGRSFFASSEWMLVISSLIFSSLLYCMCYAVRREKFSADRFAQEASEGAVQESGKLDASASAQDASSPSPAAAASNPESELQPSTSEHYAWIGAALDALMTSQEVFRNDNLLITDVAKMIGSNRTYVSSYLNRERGVNFSDYVNGYRVEYAKKLLDTSPDINLVDVAERSGFSGEASFYRVFKRITGKTPNEYRRLTSFS
jgi:AraC-like DNA-binding protein